MRRWWNYSGAYTNENDIDFFIIVFEDKLGQLFEIIVERDCELCLHIEGLKDSLESPFNIDHYDHSSHTLH